MEAPPRIELGMKVLQTSALPLGYGAAGVCAAPTVRLFPRPCAKGLRKKAAAAAGADDEIRTRDLILTKDVRYLLCHISMYRPPFNLFT